MRHKIQQIPASRITTKGFALPTILIASVVLLSVLVSAVSSTVAIRSTLQNQHYNQLAQLAGESGTVYAKACLAKGDGVTWSEVSPLRPNTDCAGDVIAGSSPYVLELDNVHTYFTVGMPDVDSSGVARGVTGKGYVEALRTSTGIAWRVWSSNVAMALGSGDIDKTPVGTSIEGYWTTAPTGYLLENGQAVSRDDYANLFDIIGTTFGPGDDSTTFNLPDSTGRVTVNKSADTEFDAIGEKTGSKTETLTIAQMPSHQHESPFPGNDRVATSSNGTFARVFGQGRTAAETGQPTEIYNTDANSDAEGNEVHPYVSETGGSNSHNNIQPSITVMRAIKY